ncbi:MAG: PHP domain-containing protein [Bacteroidetes bacterium]|jgi:predicted metal-dependent phosphoesterase TrpH|nr:PHP domain-containing protein [Bacteroidota bacterium]
MKEFRADLHIHTCLSPCADLEMSPQNIVREAKRKGLEVIGICDHNSAENVPAVEKNARKEGIGVIGGMEVTSKEEVHILALFDVEDKLFSLQEIVYDQLNGTNDERLYGEQVVVNENEEVVGFNRKLLIGASEITLTRLVDLIHERNGLAIASHVDREGFGIIGQLGFIPPGLPLDALEITDPSKKGGIPRNESLPFVTSSDAHNLADVGKRYTSFLMNGISIDELRRCLHGDEGREVRI